MVRNSIVPYLEVVSNDERSAQSHSNEQRLETEFNVLDLGCGNSPILTEMMKDDALLSWVLRCRRNRVEQDHDPIATIRFTGLDFSGVIIDRLNEQLVKADKNEQRKDGLNCVMSFRCVDLRKSTSFEPNSVHFVLDKATLDCIDCGDERGDESDVRCVVQNVVCALQTGGVFAVVTCREVERRMKCFLPEIQSKKMKVVTTAPIDGLLDKVGTISLILLQKI